MASILAGSPRGICFPHIRLARGSNPNLRIQACSPHYIKTWERSGQRSRYLPCPELADRAALNLTAILGPLRATGDQRR
jgi:hypothetical protein